MVSLISAGVSLPAQREETFTNADDGQTSLTIRLFRGESEQVRENTFVGLFELTDIPPRPAGKLEARIRFFIGDGTLTVSAIDLETGRDIFILFQAPGVLMSPQDPSQGADGRSASVRDILKEMDAWVGLADVKRQVEMLAARVSANLARSRMGLQSGRLTEHILFFGPPGTGKTSVARVIARLYGSLGALPGSRITEVDRSALVGEYLGATAVKTNAVIDSAMGGVLFIDEAYALSLKGLSGGDAFGSEAINTLIKRMEDDRDKLVVIAAGYAEPMQQFLRSNDGLASRFTSLIRFPSYGPEELLEIARRVAEGNGSRFGQSVEQMLLAFFTRVVDRGDQDRLGNGRLARNVVEKSARERDYRLFSVERDDITRVLLETVEAADVEVALRSFERD